MQDTPKGLRRHIVVAGRRNAGKSSVFNALSRQEIAIVSSTPGTTTDPVEKTMELAPLGPVVLIDTAGIDDPGELGQKRVNRSMATLSRADLAIIVTNGDEWGEPETELIMHLKNANVPFLIARNKMDNGLSPLPSWRVSASLTPDIPVIDVSAKQKLGLEAVVSSLAALTGAEDTRPLASDLLPPDGIVLLVVPIDSGAPKGRLILPQVQTIRDCLDAGKICMTAREKELSQALSRLRPDMIICDSQVVKQVVAQTPADIPLTTFSILMARMKGNLADFAAGARALAKLAPGDTVLIQEACSHHAQKDDIGRVKIPALLRKLAGGELDIRFAQGKELAPYAEDIKAIVHCGACVITARQMEARQRQANAAAIPMTNYGMAISLCQGILPRVLTLFPEALAAFSEPAETGF